MPPVPLAGAALHGRRAMLRAGGCNGSPAPPRARQRLFATPASCGGPVCTPKPTGPESRPDLRRSLPFPAPAPAPQARGQALLCGSLGSASAPTSMHLTGLLCKLAGGRRDFYSSPPAFLEAFPSSSAWWSPFRLRKRSLLWQGRERKDTDTS